MQIDPSTLKRYRRECQADLTQRLAMNAVTANGVVKSATDVEALKKQIHEYSLQLKSGAITENDIQGDFYDIAAGGYARQSDNEITIAKNGGGAHLDLMTAAYIQAMWAQR